MKADTLNLIALYEATLTPVSMEAYYDSLDDYLNQFGMSVGENLTNPKLPYNNPDQKGIYMQNFQIGKIETIIQNGLLILEHISSYNKGQGLVRKIWPHDKEFAKTHGLKVQSELVNDITKRIFHEIFNDWKIKQIDEDTFIASP